MRVDRDDALMNRASLRDQGVVSRLRGWRRGKESDKADDQQLNHSEVHGAVMQTRPDPPAEQRTRLKERNVHSP